MSDQEVFDESAVSGMAGTFVAVAVDELVHLTPIARFAAPIAAVAAGVATYGFEHGLLDEIKGALGMEPKPVSVGPTSLTPDHVAIETPQVVDAVQSAEFLASPSSFEDAQSFMPPDQGFHEGAIAALMTPVFIADALLHSPPFYSQPVETILVADCGTGLDESRKAYEDVLHHGPNHDTSVFAADDSINIISEI